MSELSAAAELLGMLFTDPRTAVLIALLVVAAVIDYRTLKIPNLITGGGILFALVYCALYPPVRHIGWVWAPAGMLLGFVALLPMYALRIMGAGDVKLMAMVGAFLGPGATVDALLSSLLFAGVAALVVAARQGATLRMLGNVRTILRGMFWSAIAAGPAGTAPAPIASVGKLAFGVSIAAGTISYLVADQLGFV